MKNAVARTVTYIPMAVMVSPSQIHDRVFFDLAEDVFLFLFTFDCNSWIERKNPMACIQAFRQAFPKGNEKAGLVIKAKNVDSGAASTSEGWQLLEKSAKVDARIRIVTDNMNDCTFHDLMRACDAYVSLHRAEGFGFAIAESMLLGKPAVVTNYSGNTEFTRTDNACLVGYELISIPADCIDALGISTKWAEPDLDQAAWHMQRLHADSVYAAEIGRAGKRFIEKHYSLQSVGSRIKNRILQIYGSDANCSPSKAFCSRL